IAGLDIIINQCPEPCLADWNEDDVVNVFDAIAYLADFADFRPEADLNDDGAFDVFDILIFLDAFDAGCP
ncbi:MAG: hypothetical protein KDA28_14605, partial [Phycisphaerales bacterium]|nr:hypothetical protein [Phycisphaerales bacterium]